MYTSIVKTIHRPPTGRIIGDIQRFEEMSFNYFNSAHMHVITSEPKNTTFSLNLTRFFGHYFVLILSTY
jgi:hypothetical protein